MQGADAFGHNAPHRPLGTSHVKQERAAQTEGGWRGEESEEKENRTDPLIRAHRSRPPHSGSVPFALLPALAGSDPHRPGGGQHSRSDAAGESGAPESRNDCAEIGSGDWLSWRGGGGKREQADAGRGGQSRDEREIG